MHIHALSTTAADRRRPWPATGFTLCGVCDGRATVRLRTAPHDLRFDDGEQVVYAVPDTSFEAVICPGCDGSGFTVTAAGALRIEQRSRRQRALAALAAPADLGDA